MKSKLLALLFGSALVLSACGGGGDDGGEDATKDNGEDTQTEEGTNGDTGTDGGESTEGEGGGEVDTAAAEKIYKQTCAGCHANDLSGQVGPSLQTIGSKYDKGKIVDIIKNGQGGMPAQNLSDEEADTVASWLASKK
ncbi:MULTISPECIES: cytochrome c551 [Pontibacillus]|uniref:Cytochrome c n=1 Tax=Pontibacillus chungwhensis TaxID=265426 RepID=A0ABY8UXX5_9BACI|nr:MULTISPECIES: cytochrome c [Pontibacillus]MCD5325895.1 cytochrome c [Pontibacillus sp. HN14]WIF97606.1 cytochrome c [Pontibacillus chungwhensis]